MRITDGYTQTNNLLLWDRTPSLAHSDHTSNCMPTPVALLPTRVFSSSRRNWVCGLASTSQHLDYMRARRRPPRSWQDNYYTTMVPPILLQEPWREPVGSTHNIQDRIGVGYASCISCDGDDHISQHATDVDREKSGSISRTGRARTAHTATHKGPAV